jgi:hypothetical protein
MYGEGDCLLGMKQRGKSAASNACQTRGQTGLNGRADVENQKRDYIPARARPVSISGEGGGTTWRSSWWYQASATRRRISFRYGGPGMRRRALRRSSEQERCNAKKTKSHVVRSSRS